MTLTKQAEAELSSVLPYLLSGGAGALVGGGLTAAARPRHGETEDERRRRIIRNAIVMGGGTALGHYGLAAGIPRLTEPLPKAAPSQVEELLHGLKTNPWLYGTGALAGGIGLNRLVQKEQAGALDNTIRGLRRSGLFGGDELKALEGLGKGEVPRNVVRNIMGNPNHMLNSSFHNLSDDALRSMGVDPVRLAHEARGDMESLLRPKGMRAKLNPLKPLQAFRDLRNGSFFNPVGVAQRKQLAKGDLKHLAKVITGIGRGPGAIRRRAVPAAFFAAIPALGHYISEKSNPAAFE